MSPRRTTRRTTTRSDPDAPIEGLPIIALVGRPNVGKSTLFNRVVGERQAVVEDRARTTRDRIYAVAEWNGRRFVIVDTGGLERHPNDPIEEKVQEQAHLAIGEADVIVFLVDADAGEVPADLEAAQILRTATSPVLVAANKADNPKRELEAAEFHRLGWEDTYPISALHGKGVADLLDAIVWAMPAESPAEVDRKRAEREAEELAEEALELGEEIGPTAEEIEAEGLPRTVRVAIVGRPNVGKSSLLNKLLGEERAIVSDIPGTTRDAIDTALDWNGTSVRLVDTAGIRRRGKVASGPAAEKFSTLRAVRAVGRADVAVLVVDASDGLTAQDAHVAGYVVEEGTGLVVAINKWDLVEKTGRTFDEYVARIRAQTPFLDFAPVIAISAMTGQRVGRVLDAALEVAAGRRRRIPTGELNRVLGDAAFRQPAPPVKGHRAKFYYATQVAIEPPTFVLFARDADSVHFSYKRYLENRLRDAFGFGGSPMRLIFRERSQVELEPRRRTPARTRAGTRAARAGTSKRQMRPTSKAPKTPKTPKR